MSPNRFSGRKRYAALALAAFLLPSAAAADSSQDGNPSQRDKGVISGGAAKSDATAYLNFGTRIGNDGLEGYSDMILPLASSEQGIVFFNPRVSLAEEGQGDFSLGLGMRRMVLPGLAAGTNLYADAAETRHGNRLSRWGLGLELLSDWVDFRANWYDAVGGPEMIGEHAEQIQAVRSETTASTRVTGQSTSPGTLRPGSKVEFLGAPGTQTITLNPNGSATLHGRYLRTDVYDTLTITRYATTYTTRTTTTTITDWFERFEGSGDGWDAELGFRLPWPGPEFRVFGGWYSFKEPFGPDVEGWKARAEFRPGPWLALEGGLYEDDRLTGSDWFVGARVEIPLSRDLTWADVRDGLAGGRARTLDERMRGETTARDALRGRESGWLGNPARQQVERETVVSGRTEHYSKIRPGTKVKREELTNPTAAVVEGGNPTGKPSQPGDPNKALATVSVTGTEKVTLNTPSGASTVTVKSENNSQTIGGALANSSQTVFVMDDRTYAEQVQVKTRQVLTSALTLMLGNASVGDLSPSGKPTITTSAAGAPVVTMQAGGNLHRVNVENTATAPGSVGIRVVSGGTGETRISLSKVKTNAGDFSHGVHVDGSVGGTFGGLRVVDSEIGTSGTSAHGVYAKLDGVTMQGGLTVANTGITALGTSADGVHTTLSGGAGMTGKLTVDLGDKAIDAQNWGVRTELGDGSKLDKGLLVNVGTGAITTHSSNSGVSTKLDGQSTLGGLQVAVGKSGKIDAQSSSGVYTEVLGGSAIDGKLAVDLDGGTFDVKNRGVYTQVVGSGSKIEGGVAVTLKDQASITTTGSGTSHGAVYTTLSNQGKVTGGVAVNLDNSTIDAKEWGVRTVLDDAELTGGLSVTVGNGSTIKTHDDSSGVSTKLDKGSKIINGGLQVAVGQGSKITAPTSSGVYTEVLGGSEITGNLTVNLDGGEIDVKNRGVYTEVDGSEIGGFNVVLENAAAITTKRSGKDYGGVYTTLKDSTILYNMTVVLKDTSKIDAGADGVYTKLDHSSIGGELKVNGSTNGNDKIIAVGHGVRTILSNGAKITSGITVLPHEIVAGEDGVHTELSGGATTGSFSISGIITADDHGVYTELSNGAKMNGSHFVTGQIEAGADGVHIELSSNAELAELNANFQNNGTGIKAGGNGVYTNLNSTGKMGTMTVAVYDENSSITAVTYKVQRTGCTGGNCGTATLEDRIGDPVFKPLGDSKGNFTVK